MRTYRFSGFCGILSLEPVKLGLQLKHLLFLLHQSLDKTMEIWLKDDLRDVQMREEICHSPQRPPCECC